MKRSILLSISVGIIFGVLSVSSPSAAPTPAPEASSYTSKTSGMKFVRIKAGKFTMGAPEGEKGYKGDETLHEVTLTNDFYLGIYEVTRGEFRQFVEGESYKTEGEVDGKGGTGWDAALKTVVQDPKYSWRNTGFEQTDSHPVVQVSWNDAVAYAEWLSKKDGRTYRLPTEAEWEYACRAGSKKRYSFGDVNEEFVKHGNVADAEYRLATGKATGIKGSDGYGFTSPVGSFKPNLWGLYDMHGNVWEWCSDWYAKYSGDDETNPRGPAGDGSPGSLRVTRGGSWAMEPWFARSAFRSFNAPPYRRSPDMGFRLALVPNGR